MTVELDPSSELRFLTEALRAHAEWQQACGTAALPSGVLETPPAHAQALASELSQSLARLPAEPRATARPPANAPAVSAALAGAGAGPSLLGKEERQTR